MKMDDACDLINNRLVYKPEWRFEAEPHMPRFPGQIKVTVHYPAQNSNLPDAKLGYPNAIMTYAKFPIIVKTLTDKYELAKCLVEKILEIEAHEAREFLRLPEDGWLAPFHPHSVTGMARWGKPESDVLFGLA
jgi:hypothetical protein